MVRFNYNWQPDKEYSNRAFELAVREMLEIVLAEPTAPHAQCDRAFNAFEFHIARFGNQVLIWASIDAAIKDADLLAEITKKIDVGMLAAGAKVGGTMILYGDRAFSTYWYTDAKQPTKEYTWEWDEAGTWKKLDPPVPGKLVNIAARTE